MNAQTAEMDMEPWKTPVLRRDMRRCVLPIDGTARPAVVPVVFPSLGYEDAGAPHESDFSLSDCKLLHDLNTRCNGVGFMCREFDEGMAETRPRPRLQGGMHACEGA